MAERPDDGAPLPPQDDAGAASPLADAVPEGDVEVAVEAGPAAEAARAGRAGGAAVLVTWDPAGGAEVASGDPIAIG